MSNKDEPYFSIITPVLNGSKTIESTINSLQRQVYKNFEFIILDGGSTDNTVNIIKKHSSFISYWHSERDNSVYEAFNKGIELAKNEWIIFVGSDDELADDALLIYSESIKKSKIKLDYISAKGQLIAENGIDYRIIGKPYSYKTARKKMTHIHTGSVHNKRLFEKFGFFDTSFKIAGDYEFFLRVKGNIEYLFIDKILIRIRMGGLSCSNPKIFDEDKKALLKSGNIGVVFPYIIKYKKYLKYIIRKLIIRLLGQKNTLFILKRLRKKI